MSEAKPLLTTARLELWFPRAEDRAPLHALVSDETVHRFLGPPEDEARHFTRFMRNAGSWAIYGYGSFVVRERGRHDLAGSVGVFHTWRGFGKGLDDVPEAGWILAERLWRQGYAAEAMRAALAWFDRHHGPRRIACMVEAGNAASLHLAERLGFTRYDEHEGDGFPRMVLLERAAESAGQSR